MTLKKNHKKSDLIQNEEGDICFDLNKIKPIKKILIVKKRWYTYSTWPLENFDDKIISKKFIELYKKIIN